MLFHTYENISHTYFRLDPVLNSIPGDAPKWSHAPLWRVIWVRLHRREVRGFPLVDPVPHHGTWAFQGPSSGRRHCTKGRVPVGTQTHPLRQSWWQQPQHLGCSLCLSCVGLSYELYITYTCNCLSYLHSHCTYWSSYNIIILLLYNVYIICVHIFEC